MTRRRGAMLITGGAGFIGTHLAERFCGGQTVVLFDNFRRDSLAFAPQLREHPNVRVVAGDVLDVDAIRRAMEGVDTVLHLAAIAGVSSYYEEPLRTLQVNILGTVNVLDEAVRAGVRRVIYFSTSEVFGPEALWVQEESEHRLGPVSDKRWVYATSKLAGEHLVLRSAERYGFAASVIRPFNIYGPRQMGEGAISNFCKAAVSGEPLTVYGDGSAQRAWCYVSDLVDAVEGALCAPAAAGQSFNIGNPGGLETTLGLAQRISRLASQATVRFQATQRAEVRVRAPVIDRARAVFGFEPKVDLDEGLRRTLDWFRQRGNGQ